MRLTEITEIEFQPILPITSITKIYSTIIYGFDLLIGLVHILTTRYLKRHRNLYC